MLDSAGQWNLLADCAKDWGFCSEASETEEEEKTRFSLQDIADTRQEEHSSVSRLVHYADLSGQEEKTLLCELAANPENANLWQLCLMGDRQENDSLGAGISENSLTGVQDWLLQGIKKGWLRKIEKQYSLTLLEYPLFVHRLQRDCQNAAVFTVGLVKIQTSDFIQDLLFQSFEKFLSAEDYFCKINELGYALVLTGRKNFSASAVMEKIIEVLERKLHSENMKCDFSIGLSEFCQSETAESMLDHAKQALSTPSPSGIKVKSFINQQKSQKKNSLVHSDEKRFLFGM